MGGDGIIKGRNAEPYLTLSPPLCPKQFEFHNAKLNAWQKISKNEIRYLYLPKFLAILVRILYAATLMWSSEHTLFLLRWRTEDRVGCVPWNAEGVVFNMYLQHLKCAILQFAFLQLCMVQFCIFRGGLGLWLMCLACIHSVAEDWASWSAKVRS